MEYPERRRHERFFAHKFVRKMGKACLAGEIGQGACYMLAYIAHTEDARGYRSAVTFWNATLCDTCGFANIKALALARKKAVAAGWLQYERGKKGSPGRYFVTVPPAFEGWDDGPTDEGNPPVFQVKFDLANRIQTGTKGADKPDTNGQPSSLTLPLTQEPPYPPHAGGGEGDALHPGETAKTPDSFDAFWNAYPLREGRAEAKRVFNRLRPSRELVALMVEALARQTRSARWQRGMIPEPAKWLRGRRWEDEHAEPREKPARLDDTKRRVELWKKASKADREEAIRRAVAAGAKREDAGAFETHCRRELDLLIQERVSGRKRSA